MMRIPALFLILSTLPFFAKNTVVLRKMDDQSYASLRSTLGAVLDIRVKKKSELIPAIQIYSGRTDLNNPWKLLSVKKLSATRALLPYRFLSPPFRRLFLKKLWVKDRIKGGFLHHKISFPHESLWSLSSWFTGSGQNYKKIKKASGLKSDRLRKGQLIKIPVSLLLPFFNETHKNEAVKPEDPVSARSTPLREVETVETDESRPVVYQPVHGEKSQDEHVQKSETGKKDTSTKNKTPKKDSSNKPVLDRTVSRQTNHSTTQTRSVFEDVMHGRKELTYGKDKQGPYAVYRLNKGEAIYSAVVVRFCGLVRGEDVNRVSRIIIQRNHIKDVTDMPVGKLLRIPYDQLIPEYKASNDPEYKEWLENMKAVKNVDTSIITKDLAGVTVILDSGHGGRDPGAKKGDTWEDDLVYDILCRIKLALETRSGARVLPTIYDPSAGYKPQNVRKFIMDHDEILNTTPVFSLKKTTKLGVNMRWVFANHHYVKLIASAHGHGGHPEEKIVFISLHADSLHPSLRGSMVYVPDARSYPKKRVFGPSYLKRYAEYKNSSFICKKSDMEKAQALSTRFAGNILSELKKKKLPVHRQLPIRSVIFRSPRSRPFVPAVLNYNRVPMRVLIEVCNLNNRKDRELIKKPEYRQQVAISVVEALYQSFGSRIPLKKAGKK